ncbi:hypothetical protein ACL02S_20705 [Nocardia sp. 004]|uniref:hypothetical protein n=1 Tax=Nocardia sp. 004 TaxID=3385978 RepID=UPI0039A29B1A
MTATLAELEARVAALEAEHADYRAVLTAGNALSQQTLERLDQLNEKIDRTAARHDAEFDALDAKFVGLNGRMRSIEESFAEVRGLLVRALDNK